MPTLLVLSITIFWITILGAWAIAAASLEKRG